ncbi:MAG TPA: DUF3300 domain-containing protein [Acetobacteraceae bacterium]|nr:DUF3300 domain-containing protein [Acetobacteraceae bacterium]
MNRSKQSITWLVSASLVLATAQTGCAVAQSTPAPSLLTVDESAQQLDQLVAPIALYPDSLVAQILAASTWPSEVVGADRWMRQHSGLNGTGFAQAVDQQAWDSSVKALTQFPLVLANMDTNLVWSTALGNAYASDPQNVLHAIQVMRWRAQQAGNLMHVPHEIVTYEGDTIVIQPADAETVYLPEYDPWVVYGTPLAVYPGWYDFPGLYATDADILFGLGVGIGAFAGFGWGLNHWRADWLGRGVVHDDSPYRSFGRPFVERPSFLGSRLAFAHAGGIHGGMWHGAFGVGNRGFNSANHGRIGGFAARGGFHIASGGFHGGGFHGGGRR